jgi:ABC-type polysaccharide/polyol phosphate transport system ATPase subunit
MSIQVSKLTVDLPIMNVTARSIRQDVMKFAVGGRLLRKRDDKMVVRALSNVTFDVGDGERVGVVGHNGAGKTTLLRAVAGVYSPTSGSIAVEGNVSALFGAGIGLDPEATGVENIRLLGAFHGLTKSMMAELTPDILDFCQLGSFIDMPVKTYSSGMLMRLAFAVATSFEPDVLILDEWLGAGDAAFVKRAQARVDKFVGSARVVLLASHSDALIASFCSRVLWLDSGQVRYFGEVAEWQEQYAEYVAAASEAA